MNEKCGYGRNKTKPNEKDCAGCYYLLANDKPSLEPPFYRIGVKCNWKDSDGIDELKAPTSHPNPLPYNPVRIL